MNNNPHNLRPGLFNLNLCFFRKFSTYLFSYEEAVALLYNEVATGRQTADAVGPPLVFLMRHALELGYKFTVSELYRLNPSDYGPNDFNRAVNQFSHKLNNWHNELKRAFKKIVERFNLSREVREEFAKYYDKTEVGMQEFERLDEGSYNFRFPLDKRTGKLIWAPEDIIDLLSLKNMFDEAMILLRHTVDVLSPYGDPL